MTKTIEDISIMLNDNFLQLSNHKNNSYFRYDLKGNKFLFHDSNSNKVQNYSATISINFEVFHLNHEGQTINLKNGRMIAYLSYKDIQELADKTFYEEGQKRIYDFTNLKFAIEL